MPHAICRPVHTIMKVNLLTHSRRDLLNVLNFEYLQLGDLPGIMSVKDFLKKTWEWCRHCNSVKHQPSDCSWQDATCYKCQQRGHIVSACKTSVPYKDKNGKTHVLENESSSQGYPTSSGSTYNMFSITTG